MLSGKISSVSILVRKKEINSRAKKKGLILIRSLDDGIILQCWQYLSNQFKDLKTQKVTMCTHCWMNW